ncbi:DUF7507 domain-containing protein, partial [Leeuwenhoekiella sp. W20_SRS_FM14]|uniref:DUF7507 domain-containing protein n=1 Tax=Leeuwenhoekiella sp. W20_SRS_FM14 TaxID=3240270 RepID=UPI003F946482
DITISVADNGGLNGVTIDADGSVIVPAATPAGTYDITYSICENLNPTNCETAVVTVVVAPAVIGAEPDDFSATPINGLTGGIAGDVTANDTFNGAPVDDDDVFITDDGGIQGASIDNDGSLIIPPGTPAGTYTIIYTICENLNPGNCGSAPITIVIAAATIDAVADNFSATPINGYEGGNTTSVYGNDTLNETGFNNNKVRSSIIDNDGITGLSILSDGVLVIPSGTPAGTYTISYQICEALNPSNCDTAEVTIVISEPAITAVNDDFSARTINGIEGGSAGNILNNDTISGDQADATTVTISVLSDGGVSGITISPNGVVIIPANTPAGTYSVDYQICDVLNPSNCSTASATLSVGAGTLNANDDDLTASQINGYQGGTLNGIFDNDLLNNTAVDPTAITLSLVDNGGINGLSIDANGIVTIPSNTKAGNYSVIYQICENLNANNCDSATILITVVAPAIVALNDNFTGDSVNGFTGGITPSVLNNDSLDGNAIAASDVTLQLVNTGDLDGLELNADGSFTIPSETPAGDYTVNYTICENLNPNNCTTATVTIRVDAAPIVAIADDFTANTVDGQSGGIAGDITDNDTLNGAAVDDNDIDITLINSGGLNGVEINNDGTVNVPPLTPAGVYTITYSICENLNPNNCSGPVNVQINVGQSTLILTPDNFIGTPVSGPNGGIAGNVLVNDTFNGAAIDAADVDVTLTNNGGLSGARINDNGNLIVPPNTPAGTYTITYSVCENLNPNNCSTTTATIAVEAADLVATNDDFSATPVNGADGGVAGNVLGNDTLDNAAVDFADVAVTLSDNGGLSGVALNDNGDLIVPPNTPAGTYTITYSICENLNPNNCQTATATVVVGASEIIAGADDFSNTPVNGNTGGIVGDVTANDTLNGDPVEDADVYIVNNGGLNGATINANGTLIVPPGTPAGTYTISYSICEVLNPNNCATTTVTVVVAASELVATNDDFSATPVNGADGGVAGNVLGNDTLDNAAVDFADVAVTLSDNGGLSGVALNDNGDLIVPPNTPAGTYTITYSICENLNPNNCQTATATVVVGASEIIAGADDFSNTPVNGNTGGIVGDVTANDTLNGDPVEDADVYIVNNGGLNGAAINANGNLVVPPGTPAGTYTISYSICEVLNPNNCATTTITVVVAASELVATNDDFSATPVNGADGGVAGNVLGNDTLDNAAVDFADVAVTLSDNGGLSGVALNDNGDLIVPPNTPAGTYTITYSICENLNPNNCQTATATVVVGASEIIAGADDFSNTPVNGNTGGIVGDVTANDTLNGDPVEDADVYIVNNGGLNGAAINANGNLVVPPGTPAGTYTISYSICEVLNPNNCATTTITVVVAASELVATNDDFSATPVNGADGGVAGNVLGNDTLDNAAVDFADVAVTLSDNGGLSGVALNDNGDLIVPPNTPAGTYTITYSICENLNPNNCQTATATVVVGASEIIAGADDFSNTPVNGNTGGIVGDVTANDTLNGDPVEDADVYIVNNGGLNGAAINANGNLIVPPGTPAGTYTISYSICEVLNPNNCATTTITVVVAASELVATNDDFSATPVNGADGGVAGNVLGNDTLDNAAVDFADVAVTLSDNGGLSGVALNDNGDLIVPPNTPAGTYTITYSICENLNPNNCQTATATVVVGASSLILEDDNFSSTPINGITGGAAGNVLSNDTLDGNPIDSIAVNVTIADNGSLIGVAVNSNGTIIVPPNSKAGTYRVTYTVCENLNPNNCSTASITIIVLESSMQLTKGAVYVDVNTDGIVNLGDLITYTFTVTNTGNTVLNSISIDDAEIGVTGIAISNSTLNPGEEGSVSVDYLITQQNIDSGQVVNSATATATDDSGNLISDISDSTNPADETGGDADATVTLLNANSNLDLLKRVSYTDTNGDSIISAGDVLTYSFTVTNNGSTAINDISILDDMVAVVGGPISLAPGQSNTNTFSATYTITQADLLAGEVVNIALATGTDVNGIVIDDFSDNPADPTNLDIDNDGDFEDPTTFVITANPGIELLKIAEYVDSNNNGIPDFGDTINYTFKINNTGNVVLNNITITDSKVTVIGGPISLLPGESDFTSFSAVYQITPRDVTIGYVDNTATVTGTTENNSLITDISDDPTNTSNEDLDGDGDPDDVTRMVLSIEDIFVYNVITPNGDGINDELIIGAIERFPDNTLRIFNRWGVEVFSQDSYGQAGSSAFTGYSNGRTTIDSGKLLPTGTYYYVLDYATANGTPRKKAGYIYIN